MAVTDANALMNIPFPKAQWDKLCASTGPTGQAVAAVLLDPNISYDATGQRVRLAYSFREITNLHSTFRSKIGLHDITTAIKHATQLYKDQINNNLDGARNGVRNLYSDPNYKEPLQPDIDPSADGVSVGIDILKSAAGMAIGRAHDDGPSANLVRDLVANDDSNVELLFIEEFRIEQQAEIDTYLNGGPDAIMAPGLAKRISDIKNRYHVDWVEILDRAKSKGIKVYAIDSSECEPGVESSDPSYGERRDVVMNKLVADVVDKAVKANPGKKFVMMCGAAHLNTHQGGVPGLSQLMGIPAMSVNKMGQLRVAPDDKSKRGMPSALVQAFRDNAMTVALAEYAKVPAPVVDKKPADKTKKLDMGHAHRVLTALGESLVAKNLLRGAGDVAGLLTHADTKKAIKDLCEQTAGREIRRQAVYEAIDKGDEAKLKKLLDEDPDLILQGDEVKDRKTLLHYALEQKKVGIAKELLKRGSNPNQPSLTNDTPLHVLCASDLDDAKTAALLDEMMKQPGAKAADLTSPGPDALTPVAKIKSRKGEVALTALAKAGKVPMEDLFVHGFEARAKAFYEAERDNTKHEPFDAAELNALAKKRFAEKNSDGSLDTAEKIDAYLKALKNTDAELKALIELTKKRRENKAAIVAAIDGGDGDKVIAVFKDDPALKRMEISGSLTALAVAADKGQGAVLKKLIAHGLDPNLKNAKGATALHIVLMKGASKTAAKSQKQKADMAEILLEKGADPNIQDAKGRTALHLAGYWDNVAAIKALKKDGRADPKLKDKRGWTPLDTTLGSTNKNAEAELISSGYGTAASIVAPGKHSSVDLLCMATRCTNPSDELNMRKMYEELYAIEIMRPILDLAAATTCNDRKPPKGGLRIFAEDSINTGALFGKSTGPSGAYDEKVNTLLVATQKDPKERGGPGGTIAHELTHQMAHLITDDEDTVPFVDDDDRKDYISAIEADLRNLHRLDTNDPNQKYIIDRMSGRLNSYAQKKPGEDDFLGADLRLLQEHLVGVPQLMAEFGPDYVKKYLPSMTHYFEEFTRTVKRTLDSDPRFAKGRAAIDPAKNKSLTDRLAVQGVGPKPPEPVYATTTDATKAFAPDKIAARLKGEYRGQNGQRMNVVPGKAPTIAISGDEFNLSPDDEAKVDKLVKKAEAILKMQLKDSVLPRDANVDGITPLVIELAEAMKTAKNDKEFEKVVAMTTETWTKKVLIDRIKDRAARGFEIPPDQMAKAIIFEAELKARGGSSDDGDWEDATLEVKSKKQSKAIAALTEELSKASSKALLSKKPIQLLDALATAAADPNKDAIRVKTAPKRIGSRNLKHVSIDVKKAKNQWLAALATV